MISDIYSGVHRPGSRRARSYYHQKSEKKKMERLAKVLQQKKYVCFKMSHVCNRYSLG